MDEWFRFGSPLSIKVVVCGHCLSEPVWPSGKALGW